MFLCVMLPECNQRKYLTACASTIAIDACLVLFIHNILFSLEFKYILKYILCKGLYVVLKRGAIVQ